MKKQVYFIFSALSNVTLGIILFLIFRLLCILADDQAISVSTQVILSVLFPVFLFIQEYIKHSDQLKD
ncbi:MAG TPA: hypothetical protein VMW76_06110 [Bacteroidales bacterium]|nr:hypothetical protein [Bacteroidales bacterium]